MHYSLPVIRCLRLNYQMKKSGELTNSTCTVAAAVVVNDSISTLVPTLLWVQCLFDNLDRQATLTASGITFKWLDSYGTEKVCSQVDMCTEWNTMHAYFILFFSD